MEIAFIHPGYPDSEGTGSTHSATQIIKILQNQGHNVVPFCASIPEANANEYKSINSDGFPPHTLTRLNKGVKRRIAELSEFDIVHSYLPLMPALNKLAQQTTTVMVLDSFKNVCPKMDLRYMDEKKCEENGIFRCTKCSVLTSGGHADQSQLYRSISRLGDLKLINKVDPKNIQIDAFQAISTHVKDTYVNFGYPKDRIWKISNILDERFLVNHTSNFESPYRLLHVGYLREAKGVQLLPEFVKILDKQAEYEFELTIVGDGPLRNKLEQHVKELDIAHLVNFRGYVEYRNLPEIYADHDLFVYPGLWDEPFGRVFLESLAAGTPIIGTDIGAAETIIGNAGEVTTRSSKHLAATVDRAISEGMIREYAGNAQHQAKRYSPKSIGPMFDKMYSEII